MFNFIIASCISSCCFELEQPAPHLSMVPYFPEFILIADDLEHGPIFYECCGGVNCRNCGNVGTKLSSCPLCRAEMPKGEDAAFRHLWNAQIVANLGHNLDWDMSICSIGCKCHLHSKPHPLTKRKA